VLAVPHAQFTRDLAMLWPMLRDNGVVIDVKSVIHPASVPARLRYWSL
jgi:hypothetical protein